jgi:hypothetical protein
MRERFCFLSLTLSLETNNGRLVRKPTSTRAGVATGDPGKGKTVAPRRGMVARTRSSVGGPAARLPRVSCRRDSESGGSAAPRQGWTCLGPLDLSCELSGRGLVKDIGPSSHGPWAGLRFWICYTGGVGTIHGPAERNPRHAVHCPTISCETRASALGPPILLGFPLTWALH